MAQSTATSKRQGKISAELRLLWPILRRWPGGYSFGEYLNAVEQHQIRLRARPMDEIGHQHICPPLARPCAVQRNNDLTSMNCYASPLAFLASLW